MDARRFERLARPPGAPLRAPSRGDGACCRCARTPKSRSMARSRDRFRFARARLGYAWTPDHVPAVRADRSAPRSYPRVQVEPFFGTLDRWQGGWMSLRSFARSALTWIRRMGSRSTSLSLGSGRFLLRALWKERNVSGVHGTAGIYVLTYTHPCGTTTRTRSERTLATTHRASNMINEIATDHKRSCSTCGEESENAVRSRRR